MKSRTSNTVFLTSASCTSSWQSKPFPLGTYSGVSFQAAYSGSFVGTLRLQVSNDNGYIYEQARGVSGSITDIYNWTNVPDAAVAISGSFVQGNAFWNYPLAFAKWGRVAYEATGSISGFVTSVCAFGKWS